jgi:hypothetical protein
VIKNARVNIGHFFDLYPVFALDHPELVHEGSGKGLDMVVRRFIATVALAAAAGA